MSRWLIEGVREDGRVFRPSDWVERLAATTAGFGRDQRLRYASGIRPHYVNGRMCLMVEKKIQKDNPAAFEFVFNFATSNGLRISEM